MADLKNNATAKQHCVAIVPIFNHLTNEEQLDIAHVSRSQVFEKGETIFQAGDAADGLKIVHKGRVKLYTLSESGHEQLIRILEPGDFMGELAVFTDEWLTQFAETLEPTELCTIHKADLRRQLEDKPAIAMKLLTESSKRLQKAEKTIEMLNFERIENRLAAYFLEQSDKNNSNTFTLAINKRDLASYLGTTPETLSRHITHFEEQGWIKQGEKRKVTILNYNALRALIEA